MRGWGNGTSFTDRRSGACSAVWWLTERIFKKHIRNWSFCWQTNISAEEQKFSLSMFVTGNQAKWFSAPAETTETSCWRFYQKMFRSRLFLTKGHKAGVELDPCWPTFWLFKVSNSSSQVWLWESTEKINPHCCVVVSFSLCDFPFKQPQTFFSIHQKLEIRFLWLQLHIKKERSRVSPHWFFLNSTAENVHGAAGKGKHEMIPFLVCFR